MADEDVIPGQDEQAPLEDAQVDPAAAEGAQADLTLDAGGDGSLPEPEAMPAAEETDTPPTLEALFTAHPGLRADYETRVAEERRVAENAGAQRREAQLKHEAGQKDVTIRNVQRWATETLGAPLEDTTQVAYLYDLAAANAARELATALPDAVLRNYAVAPESRNQALDARDRGDWDGYLTTLVAGAVEATLESRMEAYRKEQEAANQRWRAAELKAMRLEQAPKRDGAPAMPRGTTPEPVPYYQMTPEQRAAMTPEERDRAVAAIGA